MHPLVAKLLELQKVDQEISSLTKDIDSLPAEEARRRKKLDELERRSTECRGLVTKTELETRTLETAIRGGDDEIKKCNDRLNLVRNNAEYQATLFQIEGIRKERDVSQEQCLALIDGIDQQKAELSSTDAAAAEGRKVFDGFLAEAETLRTSRAGVIAEARSRRQAVAEGIKEDLVVTYDGLYKTREGIAVCAVDNYYCQGCYNKVTINDIAKLMGKTSIVECGSCQRILFLNG